jgi:hypothetical protein
MSREDDAPGGDGAENGAPGTGDPVESLPGADVDNPFEQLPDAEPDGDVFERIDADPAPEIDERAGEVDEAIVPKQRYCERCEHFDDPPAVRCTHPGTEIGELVDMDHFRVFGCPVVAERQEIGTIVATDPDAVVEDGESETGD